MEKSLYFSSNREGSLGDHDIWKVEVKGESYGEPVNLGSKKITRKRSSLSYDDNKLYFSSDRPTRFWWTCVYVIALQKVVSMKLELL